LSSLRPLPPTSSFFPYTTLFRSLCVATSCFLQYFRVFVEVALTKRAVILNIEFYLLNRKGNSRSNLPVGGLPDGIQPIPCTKERSEEHTSELQSRFDLVCRLLLE